VSLRLRSELRLHLSQGRCAAEVWPAGWSRLPRAAICVEGEGDLVAKVLARLVAERVRLPQQVHLVLADELLFYALLPADAAWGQAGAHARRYFEGALGGEELQIALTLSPCGRRWIAVAVEAAQMLRVTEPLAVHGLRLVATESALLRDIDGLGSRVPTDGVLVVVRTWGTMLLRRERRGWTELSWERCTLQAPGELVRRIAALAARHAHAAGHAAAPVLVALENAQEAGRMAPLVQQRGWKLCSVRPGEVL